MVALSGTCQTDDGVPAVSIPGPSGASFMVLSTINVGVGSSITATADTGSTSLPINLTICQTNPATGQCINPPTYGPSATMTIGAGETDTFTVIVQGTGTTIPFKPETNRIFVRFRDSNNIVRGATSMAVRTHSPACAP